MNATYTYPKSRYESHFSKAVIKNLKKNGYQILSATACPDESGSFCNSSLGYSLIRLQDGYGIMRSYLDILDMADAS